MTLLFVNRGETRDIEMSEKNKVIFRISILFRHRGRIWIFYLSPGYLLSGKLAQITTTQRDPDSVSKQNLGFD